MVLDFIVIYDDLGRELDARKRHEVAWFFLPHATRKDYSMLLLESKT